MNSNSGGIAIEKTGVYLRVAGQIEMTNYVNGTHNFQFVV